MKTGSSPVLSEFLSIRIYLLALEKMLANDNESFVVAGGLRCKRSLRRPFVLLFAFVFAFALAQRSMFPVFFGLAADGLVSGWRIPHGWDE